MGSTGYMSCLRRESNAARVSSSPAALASAMNIHEYQARQLLGQYGVALPPWEVCDTPDAAKRIAAQLLADGADLIAVKSQIHAGGRGKGTFKSGFQGRRQTVQDRGGCLREGQSHAGQCAGHQADRPRGPARQQVDHRRRAGHQEGALSGRAARPLVVAPGGHGQHRGRHGHRGSRGQNAGEDYQGDH